MLVYIAFCEDPECNLYLRFAGNQILLKDTSNYKADLQRSIWRLTARINLMHRQRLWKTSVQFMFRLRSHRVPQWMSVRTLLVDYLLTTDLFVEP